MEKKREGRGGGVKGRGRGSEWRWRRKGGKEGEREGKREGEREGGQKVRMNAKKMFTSEINIGTSAYKAKSGWIEWKQRQAEETEDQSGERWREK